MKLFSAFILLLAVTLWIFAVSAISSLFLIRAVESVSAVIKFYLFILIFSRLQRSQVKCQPAMIYFAFIAFCSLYGIWEFNIFVVLNFIVHLYFFFVVHSLRLKFAELTILDLSRTVYYSSFETVY